MTHGTWQIVPSTDFVLKSQKNIQCLINIYKTDAGQFARSNGSYDLNLGSEILILAGDIRLRSWPNIGTYGT